MATTHLIHRRDKKAQKCFSTTESTEPTEKGKNPNPPQILRQRSEQVHAEGRRIFSLLTFYPDMLKQESTKTHGEKPKTKNDWNHGLHELHGEKEQKPKSALIRTD
jgi:hypothetical protein